MKYTLFLSFLLFNLIFHAFSQSRDFQVWNSFEVEKKVTKKFDINLEQEFRFNNNASSFDVSNTSLGGSYAINKISKTGLGYRFSDAYDIESGYSQSQRFYLDLVVKYKAGDFIFNFRERALFDQELENNSYNAKIPEWYLRHRLQVKYNVPEISLFPYVEAEFYQSLNNAVKNTIDKTRLTGGLDYKFKSDISIGLFYRYQVTHKWMKTQKETFVLGTSVSYQF